MFAFSGVISICVSEYTVSGIGYLRKGKGWKYSWLNSQSNSWVNAALQNLHCLYRPRNLFLSSGAVSGKPIITFNLAYAHISRRAMYYKQINLIKLKTYSTLVFKWKIVNLQS